MSLPDAPTVAVIIPHIPERNGELLERALASVRAQTRPFDQIIVESDPERTGAADTRNRALAQCTTDYVTFLDDDDELLPNHVAVCLNRFEVEGPAARRADLVYTYAEFIGSRDPLATDDGTGQWVKPFGIPFGPAQERHLREKGNFIPVTHMVRVDAIRAAGGFPRQNEFPATVSGDCEDYGLLLALLDNGARFVHEPVITWRYYFHSANTGGRASVKRHAHTMPDGAKRVFGWLADQAGCGWYRIGMPFGELTEHGWVTEASGRLPAGWADMYDVVVGQRVCHTPASATWQKICASGNVRTVYEIDDALMSLHDGHGDALKSYFGTERVRNIMANAAASDVVTVTTPRLAEIMSEVNGNVVTLPNCVDGSLLEVSRGTLTGGAPVPDRVVVGWQGSPTHGRDFNECWPALTRLLRAEKDAWLVTMGADYRGRLPADSALRAIHLPWVEADWETYYRSIAVFDINIAPLATQDEFNRGKSDLRVLEAAALGQPVVASPSEMYLRFVVDGETGFLARHEHEWFKYLRALVHDADLREAMGAAARAKAAARTIQGNVGQWAAAYGGTV
jgi:glycosyltransferase involved in cell wall biosynthesis